MDDEHDGGLDSKEKFGLRVWISGPSQDMVYSDEHFFVERPEREILLMLVDDAKETFSALYPGIDEAECTVTLTRLRPADDFRPDFSRLM